MQNPNQKSTLIHFLLAGQDVLGSSHSSAVCCLEEMALPAVLGPFESHFQEQRASWPATGTCSFMFHYGIFFHGKIWRLQEASQPLPPPTHSRKHFLLSIQSRASRERQRMTKQLIWSRCEPRRHSLRSSSSVPTGA